LAYLRLENNSFYFNVKRNCQLKSIIATFYKPVAIYQPIGTLRNTIILLSQVRVYGSFRVRGVPIGYCLSYGNTRIVTNMFFNMSRIIKHGDNDFYMVCMKIWYLPY